MSDKCTQERIETPDEIVIRSVVASQQNQHRLLLTLECGHTMDAANDSDQVPCFECSSHEFLKIGEVME